MKNIFVNRDHVTDPKVLTAPWQPHQTQEIREEYVPKEEVDKFITAFRKIFKYQIGKAELVEAMLSRLESR